MIVRALQHSDLSSLNKWLKKRAHPQVQWSDMPEYSFIIPGVASASLRRCEGEVGILDSIVTNPYTSALIRNAALNQLFKACLGISSFKRIIGFTVDAHTHERALKHGFRQLPHSVYSLIKE